MDIQQKVYTADDLWELSHRAGDGKRFEVLNGELIEMSPTGETHGLVTMTLGAMIFNFVDTNNLGEVLAAETGFQLTDDPDSVLAPDIAFIIVKPVARRPLLNIFE
jgi:Uma2 family endonuclease